MNTRDFGSCEVVKEDPVIVRGENGRSIRFLNKGKEKLRIVRVDGCAITDGLRCDFLFIDRTHVEHFVELKGSKVLHAFKQIETSIKTLSEDPHRSTKHAYVICSRSPLVSAEIQKAKKRFRKDYSAILRVEETVCTVTL